MLPAAERGQGTDAEAVHNAHLTQNIPDILGS